MLLSVFRAIGRWNAIDRYSFSNLSAILGNEISTFPDFPAEIRAPQGTLGGVSISGTLRFKQSIYSGI